MMDNRILAAAAQYERDRRGESYPPRIAAGEVDAETASIDYQCWVAIAEWLDTGRFMGFHGGAAPDEPGAPWISWPELEHAAESALVSITGMVARQEAKAFGNADDLAELYVRRARLFAIHRTVQRHRKTVDDINRELHAGRQAVAA